MISIEFKITTPIDGPSSLEGAHDFVLKILPKATNVHIALLGSDTRDVTQFGEQSKRYVAGGRWFEGTAVIG